MMPTFTWFIILNKLLVVEGQTLVTVIPHGVHAAYARVAPGGVTTTDLMSKTHALRHDNEICDGDMVL